MDNMSDSCHFMDDMGGMGMKVSYCVLSCITFSVLRRCTFILTAANSSCFHHGVSVRLEVG